MKYVVSACLAGQCCRYNGTSKPCAEVMDMVKRRQAVPICPERLSGLPVPRLPSEWSEGRARSRNGNDVTDALNLGSNRALEIAVNTGARAAILKARSPSCGVYGIYDGTFSDKLVPGQGIWAQKLAAAGFELYDEEHLPKDVASASWL